MRRHFFISIMVVSCLGLSVCFAEKETALDKAYQWLVNQQVPNKHVPYPVMNRRNLVLSFELNAENPQNENDKSYKYIFSRSSIYDSALAIIAFTMMEDFVRASKIIDAIYRNIEESGLLWFSYNTHNNWPNKYDESYAISRNGASAWAGYAIVFYIKALLLKKGVEATHENIKKSAELLDYLSLTEEIADYILQWQVDEKGDNRSGFIIGGMNRLNLVLDKNKKVIENFKKGPVEWVSVEHNIDIYFYLRDLGKISKKEKYKAAAKELKKVLLTRAWSEESQQFVRGVREKGIDTYLALDCASWGAMFLLAVGEMKKAKAAFKSTRNYQAFSKEKQIFGHKPYLTGFVYEEQPEINQFYFPREPQVSWENFEMIWSEGSLGVAMAALKLGYKKELKDILSMMEKFQVQSGGLPYTNKDVPFQFSTSPSVAGTAWFIMVNKALKDSFWNRLFWGKE